jgi:Holliday junction DNA helicase RuvA
MISTLSGLVSEKLLDTVIIDVNGVGYGVLTTAEDFGALNTGDKAKLYIYEHIREQAHDLFGFTKIDNKHLFELLLDVNGVGPKMALNVLSVGSANDVRQAIAGGDTKYISQANGVGKRVAERIVVDLKDKVGLVGVDLNESGILISDSSALNDEAVQALMALGYAQADAAKALSKVDTNLPTADRIKEALKQH